MKFLLDHDVPVDVSYSMKHLRHQVFRLPEVLNPATSDEEVLILARTARADIDYLQPRRLSELGGSRVACRQASSFSFGARQGPLSAPL